MAENSSIEWTDHTFNPWMGCTKVSQGCKHCYAETLMDKRYGKVKWGPLGWRVRTSAANWRKPLQWNRQAEQEGRRYRVFCASLADVFEHKRDQPELAGWRVNLWDLIEATPNLDWLLLTKRPENVHDMVPELWEYPRGPGQSVTYPHNIWIGTSVENQETAEERIPHLLRIPAAVRFLSCEPMIGPIDLSRWLAIERYPGGEWHAYTHTGLGHYPIDWVIAGGESGPGARPMHPEWARSIRDQCQAAWIPFLFKQWGEWLPMSHWQDHLPYNLRKCYLPGEKFKKVGKHRAGRILDSRTWDEFPAVTETA